MKKAKEIRCTVIYFDGSSNETIITPEMCKRNNFNTFLEIIQSFIKEKKIKKI